MTTPQVRHLDDAQLLNGIKVLLASCSGRPPRDHGDLTLAILNVNAFMTKHAADFQDLETHWSVATSRRKSTTNGSHDFTELKSFVDLHDQDVRAILEEWKRVKSEAA